MNYNVIYSELILNGFLLFVSELIKCMHCNNTFKNRMFLVNLSTNLYTFSWSSKLTSEFKSWYKRTIARVGYSEPSSSFGDL